MFDWLKVLVSRIRGLFARRELDSEFQQELDAHLQMLTEENIRRGLPPLEARRAARIRLGGPAQLREIHRELWGLPWLETVVQDLRYGLRQLRRNPGFTAVAVLTLALGIGANAAIFRLVDAVRLRTLPVRSPNTLAIIHLNRDQCCVGSHYGAYSEFTYPLWQEVRKRQRAFSSVAVWSQDELNLATGGEVDYTAAIWVSGKFFSILGIHPFLGRLISPSDDRAGCEGGVDLSYSFWQRRYGGSGSVIGKTLTLNGHPFPILGVTPPSFFGVSIGDRFDLAVPVCALAITGGTYRSFNGPDAREDWWLAMLGRLKPGWNLKRATAQLAAIAPAALQETIPPQYDADMVKHYLASRLEAVPAANGFSDLRQQTSNPLWLLLGLSGLVLLIACANLANLVLARASAREREIGVRLALGASRGRMIRQLLSESALLAIAGAVCGGVLAAFFSRFLVAFISTPDNPIFLNMPTDWRVLAFLAGLAVLTTILFGLLPAFRAGRVPPGSVMKADGRGVTAGRARFRMQRLLIASQVALSLVLLAGALLFARSLENLMTRNLGFQQNGVLVANLDFTRLNLPAGRRNPFIRNLLDRVRAVPGVATAAASDHSPVNGGSSNREILGKQGENEGNADLQFVGAAYFRTMETPILAGRDFNENDLATSPKVAIVNQKFVKAFLHRASQVVGKEFRIWAPPGKPELHYTIIGVVANSVYDDVHAPFGPTMYFPRSQNAQPDAGTAVLIRSRVGMTGLLNSLKSVVAGVSPEIDIHFVVLKTQIRDSLGQDELMATLCGFFGALAVLLAAIGLYGVISYTVAQRTHEIGIRMALGARRSGIIRLILGEVSVLVGIGVALGAGLTLAGGRAVGSLLYGLKADDPLILALAAVLLSAIGLTASFVPARRATKVDPMVALRYE